MLALPFTRRRKTVKADQIQKLYKDNRACAETVGLVYIEDDQAGIGRERHGRGYSFSDAKGQLIADKDIRRRLIALAVPPAWQDVWLCPKDNGHILATGIDEKGRKQYIYHPDWRHVRELINFYRLMVFAKSLPAIRRSVDKQLKRRTFDDDQVLALMVWFLDHSYIRIGNETYFEANESIGLTTLEKRHVTVSGETITLDFRGKSGKDHIIKLNDRRVALIMKRLLTQPGKRLFRTPNVNLSPNDCNEYLQRITGEQISAKDFRTWGGTLAAFSYLKKQLKSGEKPDKVTNQAIDEAADVLGNTRTVAKAHYVHPHILAAYTDKTFAKYYKQVWQKRMAGLHISESELLKFLEILFRTEFDLLQPRPES